MTAYTMPFRSRGSSDFKSFISKLRNDHQNGRIF